ncbi:1,5-anhydro-D-fructose reductase-like [Trichosurus vulpecula]|uniref:1,5-anhydro-D-fructose reductase-like n=1 Tax=Trichosurus vulpecula TaxID=9337 RepID=UPI00186AE528|nr:1,5-anhydro-D-fructose reductase-like [Trichosurus vulpecula]
MCPPGGSPLKPQIQVVEKFKIPADQVLKFKWEMWRRESSCSTQQQKESCIKPISLSLQAGDDDLATDQNGMNIASEIDYLDTWEAMEDLLSEGLVKAIGVSNFNHEEIERLLNKPDLQYKATNNQVLIQFQIQRNVAIIPTSVTPSRIKENFQVFDFELTKEDMDVLLSLNKNLQLAAFPIVLKIKDFPFHIEYEDDLDWPSCSALPFLVQRHHS